MPEASGNMRILVVDDDADVVEAMARVLRRQGYAVTALFRSREALERLGSEAFDILVTDFQMPDVNGLDLARAARAKSSGTRVVVVTGNLRRLPSRDAAIDLALQKPIDPRPIARAITNLLTNALKYSPHDAPVRVSVAGDDASHRRRARRPNRRRERSRQRHLVQGNAPVVRGHLTSPRARGR